MRSLGGAEAPLWPAQHGPGSVMRACLLQLRKRWPARPGLIAEHDPPFPGPVFQHCLHFLWRVQHGHAQQAALLGRLDGDGLQAFQVYMGRAGVFRNDRVNFAYAKLGRFLHDDFQPRPLHRCA